MRLALAWRLRTPAASQRAAQRLVQALHSSAVRRHRAHSRESDAFDALVTAFALERQVAELDIVSDRSGQWTERVGEWEGWVGSDRGCYRVGWGGSRGNRRA